MTPRTNRRAPMKGAVMTQPKLRFDEIGYWSELKLEIVSKYASAYSHILSRQPGLAHYYIDGFAGPDVHISKRTGEFVPGSPLNALLVSPPFRHHYLVDLDGDRVDALRALTGDREDVTLLRGDCNQILLEEILPRVRYEDYRRALCLLDPCGLKLDWRVIGAAGRLGTIDLFLHLPTVDANGTPLWIASKRGAANETERMTRFWGDESWREATNPPGPRNGPSGEPGPEATHGAAVARAFRRQLREVARFANVPEPLALRNSTNAVAGFLFFASRNDTANWIIEDVFARYRDGAPGKPA